MKPFKYFSTFFLAVLLMTLLGCGPSSKKESTGEFIDDSVITTKVRTEIYNVPTLKSTEIKVETFKGVVQLSGFVNSQQDIDTAVEVTRRIAGVKSVNNVMQLKGGK